MRSRFRGERLRLAAAVAVGLLLLAGAAAGGYWYALDTAAAKYETAFAVVTTIARRVSRPGTAVAVRETVIGSGAGGTVAEVLVSPGDPVRAGDVLVRLSNPAAVLAVEQARVSLDLARLRVDELFRQAGAMQVTAPVSGRIASLGAQAGDPVSQGAVAAVIENPNSLIVEVPVPEFIAPTVKPYTMVAVSVPAVAGAVTSGVVIEVGGTAGGAGAQTVFPVRVRFPNPGGVVPGMTAAVSMTVPNVRFPVPAKVAGDPDEVLTAPDAAVVAEVCAAPGQEVAACDVLVVLESPDLVVRRDQAKLTYEKYLDLYRHMVPVYEPSIDYHVTMRLQYLKYKQAYEELDAAVARLRVTSPCRGRVVGITVREGDTVPAGAAVAQVVPVGSLVVKAQVPGARLGTLAVGQELPVDLPECGHLGLTGTLAAISPQTSELARQGEFEISVELTGDVTAWPGAAARVILPEGEETVASSGTVISESREYVRFGVSATVGLVTVLEGDIVRAGEILFALTNETLISGGDPETGTGLTHEELAARAGAGLREEILRVRSAELAYEQRRLEAESLVLRAEHDGTVAEVSCRVGDTVSPGAQVAAIIDSSALEVVCDIGELDVPHLETGMETEFLFPALPGETFTGHLLEIGLRPTGSGPEGSTYPLRFRLQDATGVLTGMSCTVGITTHVRKDVLAVPVEAVVERYGAPAVRVVCDQIRDPAKRMTAIQKAGRTHKGDVEWVYVQTGVTDGIRVEVVRGLQTHTEVVVREK